jgi:HD-GYP domain-containing protein (c-di-GMP phosphodiesterase class II)
VLDLLERFADDLHSSEQTLAQVRLILEAIRGSTRADAVYWDPGSGHEAVELTGDVRPSGVWCKELTRRLLEETPGVDGQLLRSQLPPVSRQAPPVPRSAAMVRISKSKASWVVAVSFDPQRLFSLADTKMMSLARRMLLNHRQQQRVNGKMKEALLWSIHCLTALIDSKSPGTWGHSERVAQIAVRLAQELDLPTTFTSDLYFGGLLHDLGKIGVKDSVLHKAGPLNEEERAHLREYPVIGDRIMADIRQLAHLRPAVRNHHERYDGCGYPDGLSGDAIPLGARILAVADACDAMMSPRPYRAPLATNRIDSILTEGAGSQWDPRVVEPFLDCRKELYSICRQGAESSMFQAIERAVHTWTEDSSPNIVMQAADARVESLYREITQARW